MKQFREKKNKEKEKRGTKELDINSYKNTVPSQECFFSVGQTPLQGSNSERI